MPSIHQKKSIDVAWSLEIRRRTRSVDEGTEVVKKPKLVDDYNSHMGGVGVI